MFERPLTSCVRRNFITTLLIAPLALTGIGIAQAQVSAPATPASQRNAFGEVVAEYTSPVNGIVGGLRSDVTSEPGNVLFFILADAAPIAGAAPYLE